MGDEELKVESQKFGGKYLYEVTTHIKVFDLEAVKGGKVKKDGYDKDLSQHGTTEFSSDCVHSDDPRWAHLCLLGLDSRVRRVIRDIEARALRPVTKGSESI